MMILKTMVAENLRQSTQELAEILEVDDTKVSLFIKRLIKKKKTLSTTIFQFQGVME